MNYKSLFNEVNLNADAISFDKDAHTGDILTSADNHGTFQWSSISTLPLVSSLEGTANQVLVNGTSGVQTTGDIILTLPQSIATSSSVSFANITPSITGVYQLGTTLLKYADIITLDIHADDGHITDIFATNTTSTNLNATTIIATDITTSTLDTTTVLSNLIPLTSNTTNLGSSSKLWASSHITAMNSGTITPLATNTYSLGTGVNLWANVYTHNLIAIGNGSFSTTNSTSKFAVYDNSANAILKVDTTNANVETQNIIPRTNLTYNLGSSTNKWQYAYLDYSFCGIGGLGAPSYTFHNDLQSGMYLIGTSRIGFTTNSTMNMEIGNTNTITANHIIPSANNTKDIGAVGNVFANGYFTNITTGSLSTGNILPAIDNTYTLGNISFRWANIFSTTAEITTLTSTTIACGTLLMSGNISPALNNTFNCGNAVNKWANVYSTSLTGTIATPAQANITSVGTLTGLRVNGNVGINTAPSTTLHVKGTTATDCILFLEPSEWNSTGDYSTIRFGDTNHYIRGEYGVGITIYDGNAIKLDGSNTTCRHLFSANNNTWDLGASGNVWANLYCSNLNGTIQGGSASQPNITSLGNLTALNMNGNIIPTTNNTRDIGTSGTVFANVYATNFVGSHTGAIILPDGTVGTPSLRFTNSLNMGLYWISNNRLGISCNSTNVFDIQTSLTTISSNVVMTSRFGFDDTTFTTRCGLNSGSLTSGQQCLYLGNNAGNSATGNYNVYAGANSGYSNAGTYNVFLGVLAGYDVRNATNTIFIGQNSGRSSASSYCDDNIGIGQSSLTSILGSSGSHVLYNVAIGKGSLQNLANSSYNTCVGVETGQTFKSGVYNCCLGYRAGYGTFTTSDNTITGAIAIGFEALRNITTGADYSVGVGYQAGNSITSGSYGVYIGYKSGYSTTTSVGNIYIGQACGYTAVSNSWCNGLGYEALRNNTSSDCSAYGARSLAQATSGGSNSSFGSHAGYNLVSGNSNSYFGTNAGYGQLTAGLNTSSGCCAFGYQSLYSIKSGSDYNSAFGYRSAYNLTTGSQNCAFGNLAMFSQTTAGNNIAIGHASSYSNVSGTNNTICGFQAGYYNTSSGHTFMGYSAGQNISTGTNNCFYGYNAGFNLTTASTNIGIGISALYGGGGANGASNHVAIGYESLYSITSSGSDNVCVGTWTGKYFTSGYSNVCIGVNCCAGVSANTGTANSCVGYNSFFNIASGGNFNQTLGYEALLYGAGCTKNVAIGHRALYGNGTNHDSSSNIGIGDSSLYKITTTSTGNIAIGVEAMYNSTASLNVCAIGYHSCRAMTTALYSVALGYQSLASITTASYSTAIGYNSLWQATGEKNTCIGANSGYTITTGTKNIMIGNSADVDTGARTNNINIGGTTTPAYDDTIQIGFSTTSSQKCYIDGIYGITTISGTTNSVLISATGQLGTISSLKSKKRDIRTMGNYSARIHKLEPVLFKWKPEVCNTDAQQWGLIADEVNEIFPELARHDKDGNLCSVAYHELTPLILNEVISMRKIIKHLIEVVCKKDLEKLGLLD